MGLLFMAPREAGRSGTRTPQRRTPGYRNLSRRPCRFITAKFVNNVRLETTTSHTQTSSRRCFLLLTLGGSLHVRDTVTSAHEGTYDEEEHPGTRGQLRTQADTEVMLLPLDRILVNACWMLKETCVSRRKKGDVALAETWKITHKRSGKIDHMLENA